MYIFFSIFLFITLSCLVWNQKRKKYIIKKVCSMTASEKCHLLNELIQPFGYHYLPYQDIFFSTFDAWQREFGYTRSFDCMAPYFNMVFDSEPVYFDYDNRTWLIEFWKGQYGINSGAEIGIYCADYIVLPERRSKELFHTVTDEEIPIFSMNLNHCSASSIQNIATITMPHWWLAAFRMGYFSQPRTLFADFCICFPNCGMMKAFVNALLQLGYQYSSLQVCGSRVCFSYGAPATPAPCGFLTKLACHLAQWKNRLVCHLYLFVTRPFSCTADRLLYLYFYLPFLFRRCLRIHRWNKGKKHKNCSRKFSCRTKKGKEQ